MNIAQIRIVDLEIPQPALRSKPRRRAWIHSAQRALPLNKYPEYARPGTPQPGMDETPTWVQVIAEDGTWGLGLCNFAALTAPVIEEIFAPPAHWARLPGHRIPQ